jgi:predicted ATPase
VALVAALFGIVGRKGYPVSEMTPQRQKQRTLEVLVEQLEALAAKQPVLLTYEDVHWIDPTTLDLLGLAIERIQRLPVLAIITFRPEYSPPWSGQPHVSALALTRLGRRDGNAMVGRRHIDDLGDLPVALEDDEVAGAAKLDEESIARFHRAAGC